MRVTSPPKFRNAAKNVQKPIVPSKILKNFFKSQQKQLKEEKQNQISKSKVQKEKMYAQLKTRQQEYIDLIKDLHKQNKQLKSQITKINMQQSKRQSFSSIINLSPNKFNMNRTLCGTTPTHFQTGSNKEKTMNQTFDNFHSPEKRQNAKIQLARSPFSKKPIIVHHLSPTIIKNFPGKITYQSPKVNSNTLTSQIVIRKSPQKWEIKNHSYNPSLMSYAGPTPPNQSLNNSPKKSFQTIVGLNSEIFSTNQNKDIRQNQGQFQSNHLHQIQQNQQQILIPKSQFFNAKKRELVYGFKESHPSLIKCQTIIKMGSSNNLRRRQTEDLLTCHNSHQNPLNSKRSRSKKTKSGLNEQNNKYSQDNFNLQQRINQNPLMSKLKQVLQQKVAHLNEGVSSKKQSLFHRNSQYNQNIRYHELTSKTPTKNNKQLESLKASKNSYVSNLSDKVQNQHHSQYVIQEVQSCHKTMTIVRMIQQNQQRSTQSMEFVDKQYQQAQTDKIQITDLVRIQRQPIEDNQSGQYLDENVQQIPINNRLYCNQTEQKQTKNQKNQKKVSINEDENIINTLESNNKLKESKFSHVKNNKQNNKQAIQHDQVVSNQSQKPRLNNSSQYQLFYNDNSNFKRKTSERSSFGTNQPYIDKRMNQTCNYQNISQQSQNIKSPKFQDLNTSDYNSYSASTLRSQKFKKITNKAYL